MEISPGAVTCDGCGLPASAQHVAERVERLELATRFRPIHINVLFVISHPMARREDDFYRAPVSQPFFDGFMDALHIPVHPGKPPTAEGYAEIGNASLLEFQRRGYYLAYLSECPLAEFDDGPDADGGKSAFARLAPTLVARIRFNYKPKHVALLGSNLHPLIAILGLAGLASLLLLDHGKPLAPPQSGDAAWLGRFRQAIAGEIPGAKSSFGV
jgi:hypothetical protein